MIKFGFITLLLASSCLGQTQAPSSLTWKNFDQVASYAGMQKNDSNYQQVTWHNTALRGQQLAHQSDKPLLLWLYFGDPRSNC